MRESQCEKFTGVNSWNAVNQPLLDTSRVLPCFFLFPSPSNFFLDIHR